MFIGIFHKSQIPLNPNQFLQLVPLTLLSHSRESKSELQELARQLIFQASQMDDDEDSDATPKSPSSANQPILPSSLQHPS